MLVLGIGWLVLSPLQYVSSAQLLVSVNGTSTANAYENDNVVGCRGRAGDHVLRRMLFAASHVIHRPFQPGMGQRTLKQDGPDPRGSRHPEWSGNNSGTFTACICLECVSSFQSRYAATACVCQKTAAKDSGKRRLPAI